MVFFVSHFFQLDFDLFFFLLFYIQGFKERWFKLCSNLLFYYNKNVSNPINCDHQEPVGVMVMENFVAIRDNENLPNSFSICKFVFAYLLLNCIL